MADEARARKLAAMLSFSVEQTCGKARTGLMNTPHGPVATPAFMPVGTAGSVKGVTPDQLRAVGVQMVLGNTYHLMLRPGADTVARLGGLHRMMGWDGPVLTDSGGYQVFSLAHRRTLTDDGVVFRSHIDGALVELTPARAVEIQQKLGADVIMQLDECPPADASKDEVATAVARSADWARRCKQAWQEGDTDSQALFAIQQGGRHRDLRAASAEQIVKLDLPGYAIGGLSVGEGHEVMCGVLDDVDHQLPSDRPRYLMGVGEPRDILAAVARGVDLFDCVLPTRNGRNAQAFTFTGRLRLRNARFAEDTAPLEHDCDCYTCRNFSRGVLRHLFMAEEMLGPTLVSIHNLRFFARLMERIREAVACGDFQQKAADWLAAMYATDDATGGA
ncbi:MAG: tRNA guanosine(34) transglycosylase Tgt [Phycisphaerae bacterium]